MGERRDIPAAWTRQDVWEDEDVPEVIGAGSVLSIAMVQTAVRPMRDEELSYHVAQSVSRAVKAGAKLVVFPELISLSLVGNLNVGPRLRELATTVQGQHLQRLQQLAREHNVSILGGTFPRLHSGAIHNTAFLVFPSGKYVAQDKIYPTSWEKEWGWRGGNRITIFDAPWGTTAILICYDSEFPELSNSLVAAKPELILVPSMTSNEHGFNRVRWSAQARAIEHHAYVVHVGAAGRGYYGQAALITPQEVAQPIGIAKGNATAVNRPDQILVVKADFARLRIARGYPDTIYPALDQIKRGRR